jgi:hypothetical protein
MIPDTITEDGDFTFTTFPGVETLLTASGNFDGATAKLQYEDRTGTWIDVIDGEWTASFEARFVPPTSSMRLVVTDAAEGAAITASHTNLR